MQTTRHDRTTHIKAVVPMDKSDIEAMRVGYAVIKYFPEWLEAISRARQMAIDDCKASYDNNNNQRKE